MPQKFFSVPSSYKTSCLRVNFGAFSSKNREFNRGFFDFPQENPVLCPNSAILCLGTGINREFAILGPTD
jgi:hypothetical protein